VTVTETEGHGARAASGSARERRRAEMNFKLKHWQIPGRTCCRGRPARSRGHPAATRCAGSESRSHVTDSVRPGEARLQYFKTSSSYAEKNMEPPARDGDFASWRGLRVTIYPSRAVTIGSRLVDIIGRARADGSVI
jgi:hypothetical protein